MSVKHSLCAVLVLMLITTVISWKTKKKTLDDKAGKYIDGVEFTSISRGSLLKILATIEENINNKVTYKKKRPVFTASFANNKFTKPHIYPEVSKTS